MALYQPDDKKKPPLFPMTFQHTNLEWHKLEISYISTRYRQNELFVHMYTGTIIMPL